ncbi:MAG: hypothetical protein V5A48_02115 [Salinivenus sp.]
MEVEKTGKSSYLNRIIGLVREAQASQSRTQNQADRAAYWLTLIALTAGALTFGTWSLALDETFVFSPERAVTVMGITYPHALGLAIPLVVSVSTGLGAQRGLHIPDRAAFERARDLDTVVFEADGEDEIRLARAAYRKMVQNLWWAIPTTSSPTHRRRAAW